MQLAPLNDFVVGQELVAVKVEVASAFGVPSSAVHISLTASDSVVGSPASELEVRVPEDRTRVRVLMDLGAPAPITSWQGRGQGELDAMASANGLRALQQSALHRVTQDARRWRRLFGLQEVQSPSPLAHPEGNTTIKGNAAVEWKLSLMIEGEPRDRTVEQAMEVRSGATLLLSDCIACYMLAIDAVMRYLRCLWRLYMATQSKAHDTPPPCPPPSHTSCARSILNAHFLAHVGVQRMV